MSFFRKSQPLPPDPSVAAKLTFLEVLQDLQRITNKLESRVFDEYAEPHQHMKGEKDA